MQQVRQSASHSVTYFVHEILTCKEYKYSIFYL